MHHGGDEAAAREALRKLTSQPRTVVKTSFPEDEGEVLTLDYLRFLIQERSLQNFRIR